MNQITQRRFIARMEREICAGSGITRRQLNKAKRTPTPKHITARVEAEKRMRQECREATKPLFDKIYHHIIATKP